jgi:hypothetical protein
MAIQKKEQWTEEEVEALPKGEQDYFERKAGRLMDSNEHEEKLAKAVSAFANTGGGHLIIGVADDGTFDGVDKRIKGRESAKDWFEKLIPRLVNYPLQDFRVHEVVRSQVSRIPEGRTVVVVDIGDSHLAPHQTAKTKTYYYRSGGKSEPAPHFFLDMLWGRQKYPSRKVARAWLDTVIQPLITLASQVRNDLDASRGEWRWSRVESRDLRIPRFLGPLSQSYANYQQFCEHDPSIEQVINEYEVAAIYLNGCFEELWDALKSYPPLLQAYEQAVSDEGQEQIKKGLEWLKRMFGHQL